MKILHYFLGFPPYRTGGLTKYAYDLMQAQVKGGNNVSALWPGQIGIVNHKTTIQKQKEIAGINNYELINPLPISLDEGITDVYAYMHICDSTVYEYFLKVLEPDVIHIHTLMGLHKEFVDVANKLGIRTIFTTHDYFGICPKVTLYHYGTVCENDNRCLECVQCNFSALSMKKILVMQSPFYRTIKNSLIIKKFRAHHRKNFFSNEDLCQKPLTNIAREDVAEEYRRLRAYYKYMLEHIDCIHFNSSVAENVYKKYIIPKSSVTMTITHKDIADNRTVCKWQPNDKLRLTLLAPAKPFKGFNVLRSALDDLWESGKHDFELKIFSPVQSLRPYMKINEMGYSQDELPRIFAETDILIAPSVWYETFGFTVLEAISYGVPVIVSDHVGAKDIVGDGGIIIQAGNIELLKKSITEINPLKVRQLRENTKFCTVKLWNDFVKQNNKMYL